MTIKELKNGEYFTKKPLENPAENQVWVKAGYDRSSKKYECYRWDDVNRTCYLKADTQVYTELVF